MLKKIALGALIILAAFVSLVIAALINETLCAALVMFYMFALIIAWPIFIIIKLVSAQKAKKRARRRRRRPAAAKAATPPAQKQAAAKAPPVRRLHFPDDFDGRPLAYKYESVGVYVPDIRATEGVEYAQVAILDREPDNEYDPGAVAVYAGRFGNLVKVGYLYRGRIQIMANDWIKADAPIFCQFSQVDRQATNASKDGFKINIAFYK